MPRIALCLVSLPLLVAIGACRNPRPGSSAAPVRFDSAGVDVVRHDALSSYARAVHRPEYLLTLGEVEGPAELLFGEVADAALLSDGTLAILDRHAAEVRLFSGAGEFLRIIAGRGEGPGEFSGGGALAILPLPSGAFAVPDLLNQSIAVFSSAGELRATHSLAIGEASPAEWRILSGDTLIVRSLGGGNETFIARSVDGTWQDALAVVERRTRSLTSRPDRTERSWYSGSGRSGTWTGASCPHHGTNCHSRLFAPCACARLPIDSAEASYAHAVTAEAR